MSMPGPRPPQRRPPPRMRHTPRPARPPGEQTLVHDQRGARISAAPAPPPRVVITRGPRKGTELPLAQSPTTLGRSSDNALAIPDLSVSRHHLRIERHGESWVLHDQGSGNGTRVNGAAVDQVPLRHGDEIEMGDTCLRFIATGPAQDGGGESSPSRGADANALRRRAPVYVVASAVLVATLGAGAVLRSQRERTADAAGAQGIARARLEEGISLLGQGRWAEARDKLQIASRLAGRDPAIARDLERANAELPRAQALAAARAALSRRDFAGARSLLAGVPEDSPFAEHAGGLREEVRGALDAAVRAAKAKVEARELAVASGLLEPVLLAEPARPDALALREAIAGQQRAASTRPARGPAGGRAVPRRAVHSEPAPPGAPDAVDVALELRLAAGFPGDESLPQKAAHLRAAAGAGSGQAMKELTMVEERVRAIYLRAYMTKDEDPDAARSAFQLVAAALAASDETAQKAKRWLDKLAGKSAKEE